MMWRSAFFLIFTNNCIHVSMCVLTDTASGLYRSELVWCCSSLGWFAGRYNQIGLSIGHYTYTTCNDEQTGLVYKMKVMVIHGPMPFGAALISDSRPDTRKSCKTTDMGDVVRFTIRIFVQNLWRFANLYIFGKLITPGVQKIMSTFAQPPLTLVAMATKIWEFQHKISCIWGNIREITEHLAPNGVIEI